MSNAKEYIEKVIIPWAERVRDTNRPSGLPLLNMDINMIVGEQINAARKALAEYFLQTLDIDRKKWEEE